MLKVYSSLPFRHLVKIFEIESKIKIVVRSLILPVSINVSYSACFYEVMYQKLSNFISIQLIGVYFKYPNFKNPVGDMIAYLIRSKLYDYLTRLNYSSP